MDVTFYFSTGGKFGSSYPGKGMWQPKEQRFPFLSVCVCSIFVCPDTGMAACVWDF